MRAVDGRWLWFEGTLTAVRDEQGAVAGFISTFRNIHERKLAEQALIESEARYRMLAEHSSDVLLRCGPDLRIDYVSPLVRQWGYTPEDFIGQRAGVFVHPDDQGRAAERRSAMLRGGPVEGSRPGSRGRTAAGPGSKASRPWSRPRTEPS